MQGSLIVGEVRDVLGKTQTYRRKKKNRTKRNCASLQGTSSKRQVKAEQAYSLRQAPVTSVPRSVFRIPGTASGTWIPDVNR